MAGRNMNWEDFCKKIQEHVGVKQDGDIGAKTQAAINKHGGVVKVVRECLPSAIHAADNYKPEKVKDKIYDCSDIYEKAYSYLGVTEVRGSGNNPVIVKWLTAINKSFTKDSISWCAAFMNHVVEACGYKGTGSAMARSFLNWGIAIDEPVRGCVAVFRRGKPPSGHVGVVVEHDANSIELLSGNVSDKVCITTYWKKDVIGYRLPQEIVKKQG